MPVLDAFVRAGVGVGNVALVAQPLEGASDALVAHNEHRNMAMASVTKLVTSLAALDTLGPRFKWQTRAYAQGRVQDGVLHGNLVLLGGGDARLSTAELSSWFAQMQASGLREIRGDIVLQRGLFQLRPGDHDGTPPPSTDHLHHVWPDAFILDEGVLSVELTPTPDGLRMRMKPALDGVEFLDLSQRKSVKCSQLRKPLTVTFEELYRPMRVMIQGEWAHQCPAVREDLATPPGSRFAALAVAAAWRSAGGLLDGQVLQSPSTYLPPSLTPGQAPFAVLESPPLSRWMRDMNKFSNNLLARHLMLSMSRGFPGRPATMAEARQRVSTWIRKQGLSREDLSLDNGSGLSRSERARASALVQLLRKAWVGPHRKLLVASLPVAGEDGTLSNRLTASVARGKAFLKTGTLNDTRSLAGYVQGRSGRTYAVVAVVNDPKATKALPALDAFIEWVVENG